jgi:hypothetical protein
MAKTVIAANDRGADVDQLDHFAEISTRGHYTIPHQSFGGTGLVVKQPVPPSRAIAGAAGQDPSKVTMYALRHSSITRMLLAGVPVRVVADHHDTGIEMIESTYSRHIGQHTDAMIRDALIDTEVADSDVVVPLHRPG